MRVYSPLNVVSPKFYHAVAFDEASEPLSLQEYKTLLNKERRGTVRKHQTLAGFIIPFEMDYVWNVMLQTRYLDLWLGDNVELDGMLDIPDYFSAGTILQRLLKEPVSGTAMPCDSGAVLWCSVFERQKSVLLKFSPEHGHPGYHYHVALERNNDASTKVIITLYLFEDRNLLRRLAGTSAINTELQTQRNRLNRSLMLLHRLCDDLHIYGTPLGWGETANLCSWVEHNNTHSGTINYCVDQHALIGRHVAANDVIGHITPTRKGRKFKTVALTGLSGYIAAVAKKDGEAVRSGERVLLLSQTPKLAEQNIWSAA